MGLCQQLGLSLGESQARIARDFILKWNDMAREPRRFLPPTAYLRAFEAAARTGSVTLAARELSLTQSAVSRQIIALEQQLGVELFHRERQTIRLTLAGDAYAREIREALRRIAAASLTLRANPAGGSLSLACLPTWGARWLAPRLPGFLNTTPGVTVNVLTRLVPFDFARDPFDAAIHFGAPDWPGARMLRLHREWVMPMCSPAMKAEFRFHSAADLRRAPLLHLDSRPDAWERYLAQMGAPFEDVQGALFDQFATLSAAAGAGLGVALLPMILTEEERAAGRLVPAIDQPVQSEAAYYLVWPAEREAHPPLVAFRTWIAGHCGD